MAAWYMLPLNCGLSDEPLCTSPFGSSTFSASALCEDSFTGEGRDLLSAGLDGISPLLFLLSALSFSSSLLFSSPLSRLPFSLWCRLAKSFAKPYTAFPRSSSLHFDFFFLRECVCW
eukprot:TRINITY_DN8425_c0_g2_i7.p2 TRINITY_DN8425_c0_g2~~TRINITY_DN8425_c0_g2_i7.p2  ORF type:complete len:117 (+),score=8.89 TRINITY_DN8425_c0_g2_i7:138-488(+)